MHPVNTAIWAAFRANPCDSTFEPIYRETSAQVYTICRRMLRNPEDAMDALQAAYARLLAYANDAASRHNEANPREDLGTDIERILVRFAVREADNLRKRRQRRGRKEIAVETVAYIPDMAASPRRLAQEEQTRCKLEALVDQLSDDYRLPVLLHFFDGLTHAEIAETLDVPRSTITQRLSRAIRKLEPLARRAGLGQSAAALAAIAGGATLLAPPTASAAVFANAQVALGSGLAPATAGGGSVGTAAAMGLHAVKLGAAAVAALLAIGALAFAIRNGGQLYHAIDPSMHSAGGMVVAAPSGDGAPAVRDAKP